MRHSLDDALWLNELSERLIEVRQRKGNIPVCCCNGADDWVAGIRVVRWDGPGPTRVVVDAMPWPVEIDGAEPDGLRGR